jgi:hypothetical protein
MVLPNSVLYQLQHRNRTVTIQYCPWFRRSVIEGVHVQKLVLRFEWNTLHILDKIDYFSFQRVSCLSIRLHTHQSVSLCMFVCSSYLSSFCFLSVVLFICF